MSRPISIYKDRHIDDVRPVVCGSVIPRLMGRILAEKTLQSLKWLTEDHHLVMQITGYEIRIRPAQHQAKLSSLTGMVIMFHDFEMPLIELIERCCFSS